MNVKKNVENLGLHEATILQRILNEMWFYLAFLNMVINLLFP